ncbi:MAG: MFS transporter [Pseudomonadota bacterium]
MAHGLSRSARSWRSALSALAEGRVRALFFFGISAGLPLMLIFSSLSLWLREAGLDRGTVTFFAWAALGYSFKFVWAPLVDRLPVPLLSRVLGRRRGWILTAQLAVVAAIVAMGLSDPSTGERALTSLAFAAVALGFSSATQDIVIDAYRIEAADEDLQALLSAAYVAGYRVGMLLSGAGALYVASYFGSSMDTYSFEAWRATYLIMAALMSIGVITTLLVKEPDAERIESFDYPLQDNLRFLLLFLVAVVAFVLTFVVLGQLLAELGGTPLVDFVLAVLRLLGALVLAGLAGFVGMRSGLVSQHAVNTAYVAPIRDFFARYGLRIAALLLLLVGFYRVSDIVLGVIANVFYQDLGFTKTQIANVVKTFGLFMTIFGGFLGGVLGVRYGVMRVLMLGAVLTVLTNLAFIWLAQVGNDLTVLYVVISMDNITAGLASAAFIAFLSSLTNVRFTAVQYALFSSLMTLFPKLLGGYSGSVVDAIGYSDFFLIASGLGVPILALVWLVGRVMGRTLDAPA